MDNSRDADLAVLYERFNDHNLSQARRRNAYHTFQNIQSQIKDRPLVKLRFRLIAAHRASDVVEVEKLEKLIDEYSRRTGRLRPQIA